MKSAAVSNRIFRRLLKHGDPAGGEFSWEAYAAYLAARYNFSDLSTMQTSAAASFDGTNWLARAEANFRSADSSGSICGWFKTSSATVQTLFSSSGTSNYYIALVILADGSFRLSQKNNDTLDQIATTNSGYADGAWHFFELRSSGTAWQLRVDGTTMTWDTPISGTNSGDWFADTTNRTNIVLGETIFS